MKYLVFVTQVYRVEALSKDLAEDMAEDFGNLVSSDVTAVPVDEDEEM